MARAVVWLTLSFKFMLVVALASPVERTTSSSTSSTLESTEINTSTSISLTEPSATPTSFQSTTLDTAVAASSTNSSPGTASDLTLVSTPTIVGSSTTTPLSNSSIQTTASASTASSTPVLQSSQTHGTPPGTIALAVILSIIGCIFLFAILRCCNSYRKTPHYDRVAAAINRHLVYREMTENNQRPMAGETMSIVSLPRYSPRPPTFRSRESDNPFDDSHGSPSSSRPTSGAISSMHSSAFSDNHAGNLESRPVSTHSLHSDTVSVYSSSSFSSVSPFNDPAPQRTVY